MLVVSKSIIYKFSDERVNPAYTTSGLSSGCMIRNTQLASKPLKL